MSRHFVSVKKVEELDNEDYRVLIEGFDAEQNPNFNEIITVQEGIFLDGLVWIPKESFIKWVYQLGKS